MGRGLSIAGKNEGTVNPGHTPRRGLETALAGVLKHGLQEHALDLAADAEEALAFTSSEPYDLVILDVMLPDVDGFNVCRKLRREGANMPVRMLTALDSVEAAARWSPLERS